MDWSSILSNVIISVVGIILSAVGTVITYFVSKWISNKVSNENLANILTSLYEAVTTGVKEIYQTYVEELKDGGLFDAEAQKTALTTCLEKIKANLTTEVIEWLSENYSDIDAYLTSLIESTIYSLKNSSTTTEEE